MKTVSLGKISMLVMMSMALAACGQPDTVTVLPMPINTPVHTTGLIMPSTLVVPTSIVLPSARPAYSATPIQTYANTHSKVFSDPRWSMSFSYPDEWELKVLDQNSLTLTSAATKSQLADLKQKHMSADGPGLAPDIGIGFYQSLSDWVQSTAGEEGQTTLEQLVDNYEQFAFLGNTTVAGYPAKELANQSILAGQIYEIAVPVGNGVYILAFNHHQVKDQLTEEEKSFLASIQFVSPANSIVVKNTASTNSNSSEERLHFDEDLLPITLVLPSTWQVEDDGLRDNGVCLASNITLAARQKPFPMEPTEADIMGYQSDICIEYIDDVATHIGPYFGYSGVKSLTDLLKAKRDKIQILGSVAIDGKAGIKIFGFEVEVSSEVWFMESGEGLYIVYFRKHAENTPLTADEQKITDSLKLLK